MPEIQSLHGKIALVTGANRGLGAAFVAALLEGGASKVYCGARDIAKFGDNLECFGGRAVPVRLDVTSSDDVSSVVGTLDDVDILISNAGVTCMAPLMGTPLETARATMETNFFGPLRLVHAFGDHLNDRNGAFIYVLSLSALFPIPDAEIYSASKAAGLMLGYAIRRALGNVSVAMAFPGLMDTDMMRILPVPKTSPQDVARNILDRWSSGERMIFPDRHAQLSREELLTCGPNLLSDPFAIMETATARYLAEQAKT
jgi:NAD(P)-dependent dehydrogenase (short-subunit alcohol dehydrogenase family)